MTHLAACKTSIDTQAFAKMFRHEVIRLHGVPYEFVSDRDGRFTSNYMREVCRLLNIKQAMSTAYHPQADGQIECADRVLEEMLRQYVSPFHDDWDDHLDMAEFAINDTWQESVQQTPFMLNYGQHPLNFLTLQTHSHVTAAADFTEKMLSSTELSKVCLDSAQQRQKAYADKGHREVTYDVGEQLLWNTCNVRNRSPGCSKLMPRWIGPFKVLETVGKVAYRMELPLELKMHPVFHVSLLQPWNGGGRVQPPPPMVLVGGQVIWTIDRILDHRSGKRKNLKEFLISWADYDPSHDSWEPEAFIHDPKVVQNHWDYVPSREQHTKQQAGRQCKPLCVPLHTVGTAFDHCGLDVLARTAVTCAVTKPVVMLCLAGATSVTCVG